MLKILRHSPNLRESDVAIRWEILMQQFRGYDETASWTFDWWKRCLGNVTDKIRFEYCLDRIRQIQYMRSVQGHSAGHHIDPKLQNNAPTPQGWSDYMYHVGSSFVHVPDP